MEKRLYIPELKPDTPETRPDTPGTRADTPENEQPDDARTRHQTMLRYQPGPATLEKRLAAAAIDGAIGVAVSLIPFIGRLMAAAYWLTRDGLDLEFMDHRSLGKRVMNLRPVRLDGSRVDLVTSIKRNWVFSTAALVQFILWIPVVSGYLLVPVVMASLAMVIAELALVVLDPEGRRVGDKMAKTKVVRTKTG